jgi:hypothetical protein
MISRGSNVSVLGYGQITKCCEHGDEPLDSLNCGEFYLYLSTFWHLKKDISPWS